MHRTVGQAARFAGMSAFTALLTITAQSAFAAECLEARYSGTTNCTANDFAVSSVTVTNVINNDCGGGSNSFTFDGLLNVDAGSTDRYDVGFFIATSGGDALNGSTCSIHTLAAVPSDPNDDDDVCGDYDGSAIQAPVNNVTVSCLDGDNNGFFDIALCTAWDNNASDNCTGPDSVTPGTAAKCECATINTQIEIPHCDTNADCTEDDNEPCTDNVCLGLGEPGADSFGCGNVPNTDPCASDDNVCTTDVCGGGSCQHNPAAGPCETDNNVCTNDICVAGVCAHQPQAGDCASDGNACTDDVCSGGNCTHPANDDPCNDGLFCTQNDVCSGGTCGGTAVVCDDGIACTDDACSEQSQGCESEENNDNCDDQNNCTEDLCLIAEGGCVSDYICTQDICRSPGYWSTHSGVKDGAINVGQELIDLLGPFEICGQTISATSNDTAPWVEGLGLTSSLEGLCMRAHGVKQRQLYRQLIAARLNCAISGATDCDDVVSKYIEVNWSDCSDLCAGETPANPVTAGQCAGQLGCFNNGGQVIDGKCAFGNCESQPELLCGGDYGSCPDFNALPQECVDFLGNCHAAELCNEGLDFCPKATKASSPPACKEARANTCTIDSCN